MPHFIANADYEEKNSLPIHLEKGDEVRVGGEDKAWPGWVWATDQANHTGYVPEGFLAPISGELFRAVKPFDPTVLTIKRGDKIESTQQIHGWHWCRNSAGKRGWVAGYLLRPVDQ